MPKLPRISGRECVSALQKLGFGAVRQRGSHIIMRKGPRLSFLIIVKFAWERFQVFCDRQESIQRNSSKR
jgi:predicted RNA binding protein YcfA (HicA-like mRNA interferase family)